MEFAIKRSSDGSYLRPDGGEEPSLLSLDVAEKLSEKAGVGPVRTGSFREDWDGVRGGSRHTRAAKLLIALDYRFQAERLPDDAPQYVRKGVELLDTICHFMVDESAKKLKREGGRIWFTPKDVEGYLGEAGVYSTLAGLAEAGMLEKREGYGADWEGEGTVSVETGRARTLYSIGEQEVHQLRQVFIPLTLSEMVREKLYLAGQISEEALACQGYQEVLRDGSVEKVREPLRVEGRMVTQGTVASFLPILTGLQPLEARLDMDDEDGIDYVKSLAGELADRSPLFRSFLQRYSSR